MPNERFMRHRYGPSGYVKPTAPKRTIAERIGQAGNHLALCLPLDHPPHTATYEEGLEHFGAGKQFEIWVAWKICYEVFGELQEEKVKTYFPSTKSQAGLSSDSADAT